MVPLQHRVYKIKVFISNIVDVSLSLNLDLNQSDSEVRAF